MKTLFSTIILAVFTLITFTSTAAPKNYDEAYIYEKNLNPQIELEVLTKSKKNNTYYIKNKNKKVVKSGTVDNKKIRLDITDLQPGTYYIELNGYSEKVIIK